MELLEPEGARPGAPAHLPETAATVWREIVADCPAGWFPRHTWEVLEAYCQHVATFRMACRRMLELEAQAIDEQGLDITMHSYYDQLRQRQSQQIGNLATKMRLTQQSTTHHNSKKDTPQGKPPWET